MSLDPGRLLASLIVIAVMLLVAFPIHEAAHAWAAWRLGDGTAKLFGRLSLDPRVHFDRTGGLLLAASLLLFGFGLGWAKPTPVNPMNLRGGRWGEAIVAAAGPVSNLGLAVVGALGLRFLLPGADAGSVVILAFAIFVQLNLLLMVFNLVPIPPLDGSKVLYAVLDARTAFRVRPVLERYGMLILLVAVFFPVFGQRTLFEVVLGLTVTPLFHLLVGA